MVWAPSGHGQQAIEAIVAAREGRATGRRVRPAGRSPACLISVCVDRSKINKRTVDALIKAGRFDTLDQNRAALCVAGSGVRFSTAQLANANQGGLFDMMGDDAHGSSTRSPNWWMYRPGACVSA